MVVDANRIVGRGFPPDEGKRLARALLDQETEWESLQIDVSRLVPVTLVSSFFGGFLQEIYEQRKDVLLTARKIKWLTEFPFQQSVIGMAMTGYNPHKRSKVKP